MYALCTCMCVHACVRGQVKQSKVYQKEENCHILKADYKSEKKRILLEIGTLCHENCPLFQIRFHNT